MLESDISQETCYVILDKGDMRKQEEIYQDMFSGKKGQQEFVIIDELFVHKDLLLIKDNSNFITIS